METVVLDDEAEDLKLLKSSLALHEPGGTNADYSFNWYIGPNDFDKLASFDMELEMIIPFGWSIFGTINRWVIRPLFDLLFKFMGSAGIAIIIPDHNDRAPALPAIGTPSENEVDITRIPAPLPS